MNEIYHSLEARKSNHTQKCIQESINISTNTPHTFEHNNL